MDVVAEAGKALGARCHSRQGAVEPLARRAPIDQPECGAHREWTRGTDACAILNGTPRPSPRGAAVSCHPTLTQNYF